MRYLFLDIDGVLNTWRHEKLLSEKNLPITDEYGHFFDPEAVKNLRYITEATNAKIVITSSWRFDGLQTMQALWKHRNMPSEVVGITPQLMTAKIYDADTKQNWEKHPFGSRGIEIDEWLRLHTNEKLEPYTFAIIDDENDYLLHHADHVVLTDPFMGITKDIADRIVRILKNETN